MNKKFALTFVLALFILVGSGCTESADKDDKQAPAAKKADTVQEEPASKYGTQTLTFSEDPLVLVGGAIGNGEAEFSWNVHEDKLEEPEKFMFIYGDEPDPEHDGINMWFRVHGTLRTIVWDEIPAGTYFFRMCTLAEKENEEDADACAEYSNDVEVTVTE